MTELEHARLMLDSAHLKVQCILGINEREVYIRNAFFDLIAEQRDLAYEMEKIMTLVTVDKDTLNQLISVTTSNKDAADKVLAMMGDLQEQLTTINDATPEVDLSGPLATANSIQSELAGAETPPAVPTTPVATAVPAGTLPDSTVPNTVPSAASPTLAQTGPDQANGHTIVDPTLNTTGTTADVMPGQSIPPGSTVIPPTNTDPGEGETDTGIEQKGSTAN